MTAARVARPTGQVVPACWGVDPDVFHGPADSYEHQAAFTWERLALNVCADCPVKAACLAAALEFPSDEQHGVIGGATAAQRRGLLRASRQHPTRSSMADTPADRQELARAAVRLRQAGHSARWIATRLGVGERRVQRWLAPHRTAQDAVATDGQPGRVPA